MFREQTVVTFAKTVEDVKKFISFCDRRFGGYVVTLLKRVSTTKNAPVPLLIEDFVEQWGMVIWKSCLELAQGKEENKKVEMKSDSFLRKLLLVIQDALTTAQLVFEQQLFPLSPNFEAQLCNAYYRY